MCLQLVISLAKTKLHIKQMKMQNIPTLMHAQTLYQALFPFCQETWVQDLETNIRQIPNQISVFEGGLTFTTFNSHYYIEPTLDDNLTDSITYYQENQEQLQQQLVQLLNLPIHHTPPPPAEPSISLTKPEIEESFLTLDCTALANSLSCLPMHKRLDISLELLDLCEQAPLLDSTGTVDQLCPPLEKVDLSTCTRKKDYSFKVSSSLPSVSTDQHQETSQIEDFITDDRSVFKKTPIVPVTKQVLEKCEVDEELDKLLESSLMVSQEDKVDTVVVREPPKVLTDRVDHDGGDTAELNDILDELLS